jgi:heptosyltransferase-2
VRRLFPDAEVTLLVRPAVAELFRGHPAIDTIFVYDRQGRHAGLAGRWALARQIRRQRYDLAILFQNAFEAALLTFLGGVPQRCGYATDGRSLLLTLAVPRPARDAQLHQVAYYWNMLRTLGLHGEPPQPAFPTTMEDEVAAQRLLAEARIGPGDLLIGLNPGSTYGEAKRWLPERFAETADRLADTVQKETGRRAAVVIVGAQGEEPLGRSIASHVQAKTAVLSGRTTVRELMAIIKRCALFVTNDTGPMHIAAAFQVPLAAVFGPTDWNTTRPFGVEHQLIRHPVDCAPCLLRECPIDHRCMTGVTVEEVYEAGIALLRRSHQLSALRQAQAPEQSRGTVSLQRSPVAHHASRVTAPAPLQGVTVFLDRDGTLNRDTGYVKSPEELELLPDVGEALSRLKRAGARLVVVTNQSGIARKLLALKDLELIHAKLRSSLESTGAALDAIYFCPHHPDDACLCRKPGTAMIDRAVVDLGLDLSRTYLVGDQLRDMELANRIGARAILVTTGPMGSASVEEVSATGLVPHYVASSLTEVVEWILADAAKKLQLSAIGCQVSAPENSQN